LQQFSQSVEDIVKEVTPSIVKIKVDGRNRPKEKERRYFEEYFPPDFRWREKDWEKYFKPERFRFFFDAPEKDENPSKYKKREFYFSIPEGSDISEGIQKFLKKDLKDLPDIRGRIEVIPGPYVYPYDDSRQYGLGAGIIVDADGYIVTVSHLVEKADEIKVTLSDGREFDAKLIGSDSKTGIAVIKIKADGLTSAKLGDSEQLSVGEVILAIGHPYGFENTVSLGIISGLGRTANITEYDNLIQTDAVINPGSSGGALVNTNGEVVGMNIAMLSEGREYQGIGFAIPINTVKRIQGQLIESGKVVRGWLGVYIQNVSAELAEKFQLEKSQGVMVTNVMDDSPASHAGIEKSDVIVTFDGKSVKDVKHLRNLVAEVEPGKAVVVTVIRDGEKQDIEVTIGEMPTDKEQPAKPMERGRIEKGRLGVIVQDVDEEMAEKFMLEKPQGALVSSVADASPAEAAGIKEGDIIVAFDGQTIEDSKQLRNLIDETETGKKIITVVRDGKKQDIEVTIGEIPSEGIKWRGLTLQELTDERAKELGYESDKGVLITSVEPDSRSDKAGLEVDDLIIEVERHAISNVSEFQDAVKDFKDSVLLLVKRGESARFVLVK
jgi:serine protease Do